ncbi:MAG: MBOAT family O-acyltransferase, partial [Spirochaetota bacterium]
WNLKDSLKKYLLILASIVFYAYFNLYSLAHFLAIILVNYISTRELLRQKLAGESGKGQIWFIVCFNLLNLCMFKYFYFFLDSLHTITGIQRFQEIAGSWHIILPLAISFYTFQLTAIQIDTYRGKIVEPIGFSDYFLFILFFPQLIAGPIMRTGDFFHQINNLSVSRNTIERGMLYIMMGLFKKVVISDRIGGIIAGLYQSPTEYDALSLFFGALGFTCQVYCDFSGYTDIARGLANLLGYEIPENFRGPFLSFSFREVWSRWHITLSTWLRDYLYIPLGGSRQGEFRANTNMLATMSLGGLWHGADISFFNWGFYLGLLLWLERFLEKKSWIPVDPQGIARYVRTPITFVLFAFSGVFFRAGIQAGVPGYNSFTITKQYFGGIFSLQCGKTIPRLDELYVFIILTLLLNAIQYPESLSQRLQNFGHKMIPVFSIIMLFLLAIYGDGGGDFIYFQF